MQWLWRARGVAWIARRVADPKVRGSNPRGPTPFHHFIVDAKLTGDLRSPIMHHFFLDGLSSKAKTALRRGMQCPSGSPRAHFFYKVSQLRSRMHKGGEEDEIKRE